MTRVSAVMTTHNGARHLSEQLTSIATQTRPPDELVVRDDASTDATVQLLEDFARTAPFAVRVLRNERRVGVAQNFGLVILDATGDVLVLCDQDDVWEPEKLARLGPLFDDETVDVVIHDLAAIDASGAGVAGVGSFLEPGFEFVKGCATAVRRTFAVACMPVPDVISHDRWLHGVAARLGTRRTHPEKLTRYRLHGGNVSGRIPTDPDGAARRVARRFRDAAATSPEDLTLSAARRRAFARACRTLAADEDRAPARQAALAAALVDERAADELLAWARARRRGRLWGLLWRALRRIRAGSDVRALVM